MSLNQTSKGGEDEQRCSSRERAIEAVWWREGVTGRKRNRKMGKKREI